jgi:hypothetical protein
MRSLWRNVPTLEWLGRQWLRIFQHALGWQGHNWALLLELLETFLVSLSQASEARLSNPGLVDHLLMILLQDAVAVFNVAIEVGLQGFLGFRMQRQAVMDTAG